MRTDMSSLNAGKGMAQAAHAANQFIYENVWHNREFFSKTGEDTVDDKQRLIRTWMSQAAGFGTTIVLDATDELALTDAIDAARVHDLMAGLVLDPTYPVRDGLVTHSLPVITCGYIFGDKDNPFLQQITKKFALHK